MEKRDQRFLLRSTLTAKQVGNRWRKITRWDMEMELIGNFLLLALYVPNVAKTSTVYEISVILRTDRRPTSVPNRAFLEEELQTAISITASKIDA